MNFCDDVGAGRMLAGGWGGESASGTSGQSIALCVLCPFLSPPQMQLLLSWFPRHLSLCHLGTAPSACLRQCASWQWCPPIYSAVLFKTGLEVLPGLYLPSFCFSLRWGN